MKIMDLSLGEFSRWKPIRCEKNRRVELFVSDNKLDKTEMDVVMAWTPETVIVIFDQFRKVLRDFAKSPISLKAKKHLSA